MHFSAIIEYAYRILETATQLKFNQPILGLLTGGLLLPILLLWKPRALVVFKHPNLRQLTSMRARNWWRAGAFVMLLSAWLSAAFALARPVLPYDVSREVLSTVDFWIVTDISGSMSEPIAEGSSATFDVRKLCPEFWQPQDENDKQSAAQKISKSAAACAAMRYFISHRKVSGDRLALCSFDDAVECSWPLTQDLLLISDSATIALQSGGGTDIFGPSGAVQGAIDGFKTLPSSQSKVIVIITDGIDTASEDRVNALAAQLKAREISFYVIGMGEDWTKGSDTCKPGQGNDLEKLVCQVNGQIIRVGDAVSLADGLEKISQIHPSKVSVERLTKQREMQRYFLVASLLMTILSIFIRVWSRDQL